jgi:hypothetical protein
MFKFFLYIDIKNYFNIFSSKNYLKKLLISLLQIPLLVS